MDKYNKAGLNPLYFFKLMSNSLNCRFAKRFVPLSIIIIQWSIFKNIPETSGAIFL